MLNPQHALPIENQGLDPKLFNQVVAITQSIPAHQHLHMHLLSLAPGKARLQMPTNPAFSNSYGLTHGTYETLAELQRINTNWHHNTVADPKFANAEGMDFHLLSAAGFVSNGVWVTNPAVGYSPAIDFGARE